MTRGCCGDVDMLWSANLWPSGYRLAFAKEPFRETLNPVSEIDVWLSSGKSKQNVFMCDQKSALLQTY